MVQPLAAHHGFFNDLTLQHAIGALALLLLLSLHYSVSHFGLHLLLPSYAAHPLPLPCSLLLGVREDVTVIIMTAEHYILLVEVEELLWEPILHIRVLDVNALLRLVMQSQPHFEQREVLLVEASRDLSVVDGCDLNIRGVEAFWKRCWLEIGNCWMARRMLSSVVSSLVRIESRPVPEHSSALIALEPSPHTGVAVILLVSSVIL